MINMSVIDLDHLLIVVHRKERMREMERRDIDIDIGILYMLAYV